jgi:hypothetical protein
MTDEEPSGSVRGQAGNNAGWIAIFSTPDGLRGAGHALRRPCPTMMSLHYVRREQRTFDLRRASSAGGAPPSGCDLIS